MKEFIEKLIGRLEEESDYEPIDYDYCDMSCSGEEHFISTHKAIEIVNQLAEEYKDADEQGRLLPYKIGDKFYKPIDWKNCIDECKVSSLTIKSDGSLKIRLSGMFGVFEIATNDIGKSIFLTREEAEQALAEMKGVK